MSNTLAALQVRIDRLCRARDEEARRRSNPLRVTCWLPAKDNVAYGDLPREVASGIFIYRTLDEEAFRAWMNGQDADEGSDQAN